MNIQSWILLLAIVIGCAYIIYNRYIKDTTEVGCKDCPGHNPKMGYDKDRIKKTEKN